LGGPGCYVPSTGAGAGGPGAGGPQTPKGPVRAVPGGRGGNKRAHLFWGKAGDRKGKIARAGEGFLGHGFFSIFGTGCRKRPRFAKRARVRETSTAKGDVWRVYGPRFPRGGVGLRAPGKSSAGF